MGLRFSLCTLRDLRLKRRDNGGNKLQTFSIDTYTSRLRRQFYYLSHLIHNANILYILVNRLVNLLYQKKESGCFWGHTNASKAVRTCFFRNLTYTFILQNFLSATITILFFDGYDIPRHQTQCKWQTSKHVNLRCLQIA
jgi:hypothetical protein